jgi:FtsH-binding integral membrane protein
MHLIGLACLSNIVDGYWGIFMLILFGSMFYFYTESVKQKAISLFVFSILYAYIGFNVLLFHLFENIDFGDIWEIFFMLIPAYFIGSIVGFVLLIKNFKKR